MVRGIRHGCREAGVGRLKYEKAVAQVAPSVVARTRDQNGICPCRCPGLMRRVRPPVRRLLSCGCVRAETGLIVLQITRAHSAAGLSNDFCSDDRRFDHRLVQSLWLPQRCNRMISINMMATVELKEDFPRSVPVPSI
jgi:hypothetical protein